MTGGGGGSFCRRGSGAAATDVWETSRAGGREETGVWETRAWETTRADRRCHTAKRVAEAGWTRWLRWGDDRET
jgi:hypothetical protein